jgi:hypothetical protein
VTNLQSRLETAAQKRALCAPGHLLGADPSMTLPSQWRALLYPFVPSERRVLFGSAPIKWQGAQRARPDRRENSQPRAYFIKDLHLRIAEWGALSVSLSLSLRPMLHLHEGWQQLLRRLSFTRFYWHLRTTARNAILSCLTHKHNMDWLQVYIN